MSSCLSRHRRWNSRQVFPILGWNVIPTPLPHSFDHGKIDAWARAALNRRDTPRHILPNLARFLCYSAIVFLSAVTCSAPRNDKAKIVYVGLEAPLVAKMPGPAM